MNIIINQIKKFNRNYQNKVSFKILFWSSLILLSLLSAYLIETFIFNYGRFHSNRLNDIEDVKISYRSISEKDDILTVENTDARISLKFPKETYIDRIRFETDVIDGPIYYQVEYTDDFYFRDTVYLPVFTDSTHSIVIDGTVETVNLLLIESKGKTFTFDLLDVSYDFSLKPVRFLVTCLICFLFFILVGFLIGTLKFKLQWIGLLFLLIFGSVFSFLIPPGYTDGDYDSLIRAFYTARGDLIVREGEEVLFPEGFVELTEVDYRSNEDYFNYLERVKEQLQKEPYLTDREISNRNDLVFLYLPGALGVIIAESLHLSLYGILVLIRLINTFIFAIFSFFAIRYSKNKMLTLSLSVLPGLLVFVASPSGAGLTAGALNLGVSLFYKYRTEEITQLKYFIILILFLIASLYSLAMSFIILILLLLPEENFKNKSVYYATLLYTIFLTGIVFAVHLYFENAAVDFSTSEGLKYLIDFPLSFFSQIFIYLRSSVLSFELGNTITALGKIYDNYGILSYLSLLAIALLAFKKPKEASLQPIDRIAIILLVFFILVFATARDFIVTFDQEEIKASLIFIYFPILMLFVLAPSLQNNQFYIKTDTKILDNFILFYIFIVLAAATYILLRIFYS